MPYFEMWWGSTDHPPSEGTTSLFGPAGVTVQGTIAAGLHKVSAHFFAGADRLAQAKIGTIRVASVPMALITGTLEAQNGGSLLGDGDPHTTFHHRMRQTAFIGGRQVAQAVSEHKLADITGDNKRQHVTLGPESFPALVFSLVQGAELRIDLDLEIDSHYHKTRKASVYSGVIQFPQWCLILGVGG